MGYLDRNAKVDITCPRCGRTFQKTLKVMQCNFDCRGCGMGFKAVPAAIASVIGWIFVSNPHDIQQLAPLLRSSPSPNRRSAGGSEDGPRRRVHLLIIQ